ncbi:MAG TPA: AAA family ATPase [Gaiellaceae bacterium]|nr:AAA family ATPase [Gaiellaceae bacterium]
MPVCAGCGYESAEPFRFCPSCGEKQQLDGREVRKTVTTLFSDVVGSTSLGEAVESELLRRVIRRFFEEARVVVERHGGSVEMFIGDAVVALFGVPVAREDDALRALRAACEIRARLVALNDDFERDHGFTLGVRTGVNTGEVIVGETSLEGFRASGDTMNVGARLEQSASPGEILIGALTRELGGDAIVVEVVEPLDVKGKADPLVAFRLLEVLPATSPYARREDAPLVGRSSELASLRDALRTAEAERQCVLTTIVGPAGVGKSRLARAFLDAVDESTLTLVGRCVSYGEGITFLPLTEALGPVLGDSPHARVLELLGPDDRAASVADAVGSALGFGDSTASTEETFWACRRLLESLARELPLVLVVDDIHWAEPTLLDLLEYIASFSTGSPMMILCLSRPELLEERPTWAAPRENNFVTVLSPLADDESFALVESLSADRERSKAEVQQIVAAADGNPLFLEQLLALDAGRDREGELVIPPTIQALLAARLDQLEEPDRRVLECASIEGREFHRELVVELVESRDRRDVASILLGLARRQFIRPVRSAVPGDDVFAFVHALVRDAVYLSMPKEQRADLHLRVADYLERGAYGAGELVGFHVADAVRYRRELGATDELTRDLAGRAAARLSEAAQRALDFGDDRAAAKLLERATELVPVDEPVGLAMRLDLGSALAGSGRLDSARAAFSEVAAAAERAGQRSIELRADIGLLNLRTQTDIEITMAEVASTAERALEEFEQLGDEHGLAAAWWLVHWSRFRSGQYALSLEAAEQAVEHARRAGHRREELRALGAIAMALKWGPTPVAEGLRRCDELVERAGGAQLVQAFADRNKGVLYSMIGELELGRAHIARAVEIYEELGLTVSAIGTAVELEPVDRQAGRLDAAEELLRSAYMRMREIGDIGYLSWIAPRLARILALRGDAEGALELAARVRGEMQTDHSFGQIGVRVAEATALAAQGRGVEADAVALEALELVERTDMLDVHGDVLEVIAGLDLAAGREGLARERFERALALYEQKGDVVAANRVRERGS